MDATKSISRICLFPGTFDPFTVGHIDVINRALPLFDKIYVGIGENSQKSHVLFSSQKRLKWIKEVYKDEPRIHCLIYSGLTIELCKKIKAHFILRGIRYVNDFEYEKAIADMNRMIEADIETIFLTCSPKYTSVASTLVREVYRNGGDATAFLPKIVSDDLYKKKTRSA